MADTLTALDGSFLRLEELDEGALMNIGGVMVFDPPAGGVAPTVEDRLTFLFVDLPIGEPLAEARLRRIAAATRRRKFSGAAQATSTMIGLAALAPPAVANGALARTVFSRRMFNLAVTNVPGSPAPLYALGALLREIHPVLPLLADHAVGVAALSYNGLVTFGINADAASTPDIDVLARGIAEGIQELRALLPDTAKIAGASR